MPLVRIAKSGLEIEVHGNINVISDEGKAGTISAVNFPSSEEAAAVIAGLEALGESPAWLKVFHDNDGKGPFAVLSNGVQVVGTGYQFPVTKDLIKG